MLHKCNKASNVPTILDLLGRRGEKAILKENRESGRIMEKAVEVY
jgi:hypothetical protein